MARSARTGVRTSPAMLRQMAIAHGTVARNTEMQANDANGGGDEDPPPPSNHLADTTNVKADTTLTTADAS